jgi:hypothetical protein
LKLPHGVERQVSTIGKNADFDVHTITNCHLRREKYCFYQSI